MPPVTTKTLLVSGATGRQGGAVIQALVGSTWKLRALTRRPGQPTALALAERGVDLFAGDMDDAASLARALDGADAVFSVQTFMEKGGVEAEERQGRALADAAKKAGVKHFVYSSVGGAERRSGVPHFDSKWRIEEHVRALGLPYTVLRPVMFMDMLRGPSPVRSAMLGLFRAALGRGKELQSVATTDIGHFARLALDRPGEFLGREIEIAGDSLTVPQMAATLARVHGQLPLLPLPRLAVRALPHEMRSMLEWFANEGYAADIPALRRLHPGLLTFEAWLRRWSDVAG